VNLKQQKASDIASYLHSSIHKERASIGVVKKKSQPLKEERFKRLQNHSEPVLSGHKDKGNRKSIQVKKKSEKCECCQGLIEKGLSRLLCPDHNSAFNY